MSETMLFERVIVEVFAEGDAWHVWLRCGHEAMFVVWPSSPLLQCAQCVHDYMERRQESKG